MASQSGVAYNPNDPVQQHFLSVLALGETGNSSFAATEGVGGQNLAGVPTDQFGFPNWGGTGTSHAAGIYQFQPQTWDSLAQEYGLNFSNPQDQNAGAWYAAQQADPNLEADLTAGNYSKVQGMLQSIWPSVTGNQSNPQGLATALGGSTAGANIPGGSMATPSPTGSTDGSGSSLSPFSIIENWFLRGGMIFIGIAIVIVALYFLLSSNGYIPTVSSVAKKAAMA